MQVCHLLNTLQYGLAGQRADALDAAKRAVELEPEESLSRQLLQYIESNIELANFTLELFPLRFIDLRDYSGAQRAVEHNEDVRLNRIQMPRQPRAGDDGSLMADLGWDQVSGLSDNGLEASSPATSVFEDTDEESEEDGR